MFGYDLKQAFTYFLKDEHKILKLFVLYFMTALIGILNFVSTFADKINISAKYLLLAFLLFVILGFYYSGYLAVNLNSRIIKSENKLPKLLDCAKYLIAGFKYSFGLFLYQFIFSIFIGLSLILIAVSVGTMSGNLPIGIILLIIGIIILTVLVIYVLLCIIGGSIAFCTNLKFSSMFNSKLLNTIIFKNFKSISKVLLIAGLFAIICAILSVILCLTIVGIVLIPAVWLIVFLAIADIYAQYIRKILNTDKRIEQGEVANG